jgi:hypothetical protein
MPTLQTQSTNGTPLVVIYPAEKPSGYNTRVAFRVGKKTVLPAYTSANFPHLVQFQNGQQIVMFMISDVLEKSYLRQIRNAYTFTGKLDIDSDLKISAWETRRIVRWLKEQSAALGVGRARPGKAQPVPVPA